MGQQRGCEVFDHFTVEDKAFREVFYAGSAADVVDAEGENESGEGERWLGFEKVECHENGEVCSCRLLIVIINYLKIMETRI